MAAQWCDFPSGDIGLYGLGAVSGIRDGTPYGAIGRGVYADPDPELPDGRCWRLNGGADNDTITSADRINIPNPHVEMGVSARYWQPVYGTSRCLINSFVAVDFQKGYCLAIEANGALSVYRRLNSSTLDLLASTVAPITTTNAWIHLSFKANGSTGEYSVEREGVPIVALTGTDPDPLDFIPALCVFSDRGSTGEVYVKDLFLWDSTGTVNNDHPGPVTVYRRVVNSDFSSGWTKSTGTSDYQLLDESPFDDTDYISADDTLPAPSIMGLVDLPPDVVSVRGVMSVVRMRKTDGGDCRVQVSLSPDGTNWDAGADRPITTSNTFWPDWSELSPATGDPWTPVEFNSARIKVDRTL